jgi:hypothetical protein
VPTRPSSVGRYAFLFLQGLEALHRSHDGGPVGSPEASIERPSGASAKVSPKSRSRRPQAVDQEKASARSPIHGGTRLARLKGSYVM